MIKLFACDLDGTLLNCLHAVDGSILRSLREVTSSGAQVTIATGRTVERAADMGFEDVPMNVVCSNGALIRDAEGRLLKSFPMDKAALEELLVTFPGACFECVAPEGTYVRGTREQREAGFRKQGPLHRIIFRSRTAVRAALDRGIRYEVPVGEILEHDICKINCRVPDAALRAGIAAHLAAHGDVFCDAPFQPVMFEITDRAVNKGASVSWLARHLGAGDDEVAVYGDGGNDIVMLERFGHSYATANGSDAAKAAASRTIGSCAFHAVPRHMVETVRRERGRVTIA